MSPPEGLRQFQVKGAKNPPFTMLADPKCKVYKGYNVRRSKLGILRGSAISIFNGSIKKMERAGIPMSMSDIKPQGNLDTIPCDYLIDEKGIIVDMFMARNVNDTMPWERIEAFCLKRCTCNGEDCLSKTCRENFKKRKEAISADGIFCG